MCNHKCWNSDCNRKWRIDNWLWRWYCIKHWRFDYKRGIERWFKNALKQSRFSLKRLFMRSKKCECAADEKIDFT